ncbi:MAG: hypothetical protein AAFN78_17645, partial [Pseudomonadota bacterium]
MYIVRQSTPRFDITHRVQCALFTALLFVATAALGDGTEMLDSPSIPISTGSGAVANGVGTQQAQPVDLMLMVPAGATINQVLLYWGDRYPQGSANKRAGHRDAVDDRHVVWQGP